MQVKIYESERHERGRRWYILFFSFFISLIVFSLLVGNYVGVIVMFIFLGGYILYSFILGGRQIYAQLLEEGLMLDTRLFSWADVSGFVLEIDAKTQKLKNIVFLIKNMKFVCTFSDDRENIKEFVKVLSDIVPMMSDYEQSWIEKMQRKLKI